MAESIDELPLVPYDDDDFIDADTAIDVAAASALAAADAVAVIEDEEEVAPVGRTWLFDFDARSHVRRGSRPAVVRGQEALAQRVLMAVHTARFAYPMLPEWLGFERFDDVIGRMPPQGYVSDFERRLRECVEAVPGVTALAGFEAHYDPVEGVFSVDDFVVVSDSGARVPLGTVQIEAGGPASDA